MNIVDIAMHIMQTIRDLAPRDTGNLADNAIRVEQVGKDELRIYVHTDGEHTPGVLDGIAPYQKYVNDKPTLVNGEPNKNYGWWEAAVELAVESAAEYANGRFEK